MTNKEAILQILDRIAQLAKRPENQWLQQELRIRFDFGKTEFTDADHRMIENMEKYLSLDYRLKQVTISIGYDYIETIHLKERLVSDWFEMKRYRYGIAERLISYIDFCSHVHFQAEGLINYYHYKRNNGICDIDWFNDNIDEYARNNPKFKLNRIKRISATGKPMTLDDINHSTKKYVFFNVVNKKEIINRYKAIELSKVLGFVQKVRNEEAVHRSPGNIDTINKEYSFEAIEYSLFELNSIVKVLTT